MKYLLKFNEGLFSTYTTDQEIADFIYQYLLYKKYLYKNDNGVFTVFDVKLDEYSGTYNIISTKSTLVLEYYKSAKLVFKKELNCSISTMVNIYNLLSEV